MLAELPIPSGTNFEAQRRIKSLRDRLEADTVLGESGVLVWADGGVPVSALVFREAFVEVPGGQPEAGSPSRVRVRGVEITCTTCGHILFGPVSGWRFLDFRDVEFVMGHDNRAKCKVCGFETPLPAQVREWFKKGS